MSSIHGGNRFWNERVDFNLSLRPGWFAFRFMLITPSPSQVHVTLISGDWQVGWRLHAPRETEVWEMLFIAAFWIQGAWGLFSSEIWLLRKAAMGKWILQAPGWRDGRATPPTTWNPSLMDARQLHSVYTHFTENLGSLSHPQVICSSAAPASRQSFESAVNPNSPSKPVFICT